MRGFTEGIWVIYIPLGEKVQKNVVFKMYATKKHFLKTPLNKC